MSEHDTAPSEQPAPDTATPETSGEQPQATDHSEALKSMDRDAIGEALFGDKKEPDTITSAEEAPDDEADPEKPDDGEKPDPEAAPEAEKKDDLRRLAMGGVPLTERQQMAEVTRMIRTGEASTQVEALQKMGVLPTATPGEQPAAADEQADPEPEPAPSTPAAIEANIATLREQRKQAKADYDADEEDRLTNLIEDSLGDLAQAKIEAVNQQSSAKGYQAEYLAAVDAMEEKHAWTTDEESPLYGLLLDRIEAAKGRNDPALQDPNFIGKFADQIAKIATPPSPAPRTKAPAPPENPPRVKGTGVAPGHGDSRLSEQEKRTLLNAASKDELGAALFGS